MDYSDFEDEDNHKYNGLAREALFKQLLHGSSPRNPTYILGRVISDFTAQGSTELSVRRGEEIFILFEINDWAFVTVFTNTERRGYVPLDYCDVVKDFYELNPKLKQGCYQQTAHKTSNLHNQVQASKVYETRRISRNPKSRKDNPKHQNLYVATEKPEQLYLANERLHEPQVEPHRITKSVNDLDVHPEDGYRLYEERSPLTTRSTPTYDIHHRETKVVHSELQRPACYCCCNHRVCQRRESGYQNVLHYLSQQPNNDGLPGDGSESGLGDSESINSLCDMPILSPSSSKSHARTAAALLSNISTQTSQSLEDIQKHLSELQIPESPCRRPDKPQRFFAELDIPTTRKIQSPLNIKIDQSISPLPPNDLSSPRLSVDSVLSDSVFERSLVERSPNKPHSPADYNSSDCDSGDESDASTDSQYDTVKRRLTVNSSTSGVVSSMESSDENGTENSRQSLCISDEESDCDIKPIQPEEVMRRRVSFPSIPILEKGTQPNRVELTRLSLRIKEKLKPARDELLAKTSLSLNPQKEETCGKSSPITKSTHSASTLSPIMSETESDSSSVNTNSRTDTNSRTNTNIRTKTNSRANTAEIKQRKMTLQSIQEQYMRLEEARLLHNALKHLNTAITEKD